MTRRILVTGGTGFVGQHLLRALEADMRPGDEIVVASHGPPPGQLAARCAIRPLDVRSAGDVDRFVAETRPTHTIHLAAVASVSQAIEAPATAWSVNVGGSINLAAALAAHAPGSTLLFVSTAEVYGRSVAEADVIDEGASLQPANPYARSKAAAEAAVTDIAPASMRVVIMRPFNHTGPDQDERFVVPGFAAQIARIEAGLAEPLLRVGNLSAERDFLDVRDVARAYSAVLRRADELPCRPILNVASGVPRRIADVLEELRLLARREFAVEIDPERLRPSDVPRSVGSSAAIEKLVGWRPEIPWSETLRSVLDESRAKLASVAATKREEVAPGAAAG
jgi:GDP-4-dehydro-6-deoxy-D-mannose reductase